MTNPNTATQAQSSTSTGEATQTSSVTTGTAPKKEKLTRKIQDVLAALPAGATMTVTQVQSAVGATGDAKKENVVQSTLSQLVKKKRVEKVNLNKRQPGYRLPQTVK